MPTPDGPRRDCAPTGAQLARDGAPTGAQLARDGAPTGAQLARDLRRLATNLRWVWHAPTRRLFNEIAPALWRRTGRNPVALVDALDEDRLRAAVAHRDYADRVAEAVADLDAYLGTTDTWFVRQGGDPDRTVAYLSAEFAAAGCLRIYSGGLGVLAGDHLRSASDLGLPLVGIGLAYRHGYFTQRLDPSGWQEAEPAVNDWPALPVEPVVEDGDGRPLTVTVALADGAITVRAWRAQVGRVPLYLLDTDVEANPDHHRAITDQLYGGDQDTRIRQELVLGVGGLRLLDALGIRPAVYHLNEGHAAFAGIERLAARLPGADGLDAAVAEVRDELAFTTHTPVAAGHDYFDRDRLAPHLRAQRTGQPAGDAPAVDVDDLWELATGADDEPWCQTIFALSLSGRANGVSRRHGGVSRRMWSRLWPERPADEAPIGHITNGIHPDLWVGREIAGVLDWHLGPGWRDDWDPDRWGRLEDVDPAVLWQAHVRARRRMLGRVRDRLAAQARRGVGPDGRGLDPDALTIAFARRFATYKRATLLAHDVDRLAAILTDADRPAQVLVAGKAHPADGGGKALIQQIVELSRDPRVAGRVVFLEGYDLPLARRLVAGVDVWLNNPLPPKEASGTSGMKAAMNGGLNLSVPDGWWAEALDEQGPRAGAGLGWAIGDGAEVDDREARDAADAEALYTRLEADVVPAFYDRDDRGVPQRWVAMMTDAIRLLGPRFSSHRMVADYARGPYGAVG